MNVSPQLTSEEFSQIHNACCDIHSVLNLVDGVLDPKLVKTLKKAVQTIQQGGLKRAYEADSIEFDRAQALYDKVRTENGLVCFWSMEDVDFNAVPFPHANTMVYEYAGERRAAITVPEGSTWKDLWRLADRLMEECKDKHHVYIENMALSKNKLQITLTMGS